MGNRTTAARTVGGTTAATTYATNALNQYTAVNAAAPTYDANGNTLSIGLPASDPLTSLLYLNLGYDGQSRLTAAQTVEEGGGVTHAANFVYDARNRQVSRTVDGVTTWFVWDGWSLLAEYRMSGGTPVLAARYIHGPRLDEILLQEKPGQTLPIAYLHEDALGSTYLLTNASGVVVERYSYTAFGEVSVFNNTGAPVSTPKTRFLYTGREWISEIGLNDHRNRFYIPSVGRWPNRDPIGINGGSNVYAYVKNSGTYWIDSLGLVIEAKNDAAKAAVERVRNSSPEGKKNVEQLEKSKNKHTIEAKPGGGGSKPCDEKGATDSSKGSGTDVGFDPNGQGGWTGDTVLAHELQHSADADSGKMEPRDAKTGKRSDNDKNGYPDSEDRAVSAQNAHSKSIGEPTRADYGDANVDPNKR
jgi:RHS repeat-associated protein